MTGDIHGEFKAIGNHIKQHDLMNCVLIFCGDFGLGFSSVQSEISDLKNSNKVCDERNIECFVLRGNHDNPSYFNDSQPKLVLSCFKTVSDYTVIQTPEHNILCLGGAVSVDRGYRQAQYKSDVEELMKRRHYNLETASKKAKLYWWKDEAFVYNTEIVNEITKAGINIDVVASHSAPDFCQPLSNSSVVYWSKMKDKTLPVFMTCLKANGIKSHIGSTATTTNTTSK